MKYVILVTMFFANPNYSGNDAVVVDGYKGKSLEFKNIEDCIEHVNENHIALREFATKFYKDKAIPKQILCVEKGTKT